MNLTTNKETRRHSHKHYSDDADKFREESLRAIRIRKIVPKILTWILSIIALLVVAVVFLAYFIDR